MKTRNVVLGIICLLGGSSLFAQSIELRPIAMYTFRETFPTSTGEARINDGAAYGIQLAYVVADKADINFAYQIQPTTVDLIRYPSSIGDKGVEANVSNYQLGFNRNHLLAANHKVIPYTGAKVGVVTMTFPNDNYDNITKMSIGLNVGAKIMFSDKIGLNLFGLLQAPVGGFALTAGTGGVGAGTYSYIIQFSLGGGLVFKLK
jgi:hypothetical protein